MTRGSSTPTEGSNEDGGGYADGGTLDDDYP